LDLITSTKNGLSKEMMYYFGTKLKKLIGKSI